MPDPIVFIDNLSKSYGPVSALAGISLEVRTGMIFGLLGPNGAGKSTTVKILTTVVRPDGGKVQVCGFDVLRHSVKVRSLIGYVPQELTVDPYLTAREHLNYYADLYHLSAGLRESRIEQLLVLVGLAQDADRRVKHFSGGMKKKLDLVCGLVHQPPLIFLDEPSLGLDVHVRREVWNHILQLKKQGTTLFLCTNYMDEAERLCDRVAIIDRGKLAAVGSPAELRSQLKRDVISLEVASSDDAPGERLIALENVVSKMDLVRGTVRDGVRLKVYVDGNEMALPQILQAAAGLGIPIQTITYSRPGLDEVFLHHTGHPIGEGDEEHV